MGWDQWLPGATEAEERGMGVTAMMVLEFTSNLPTPFPHQGALLKTRNCFLAQPWKLPRRCPLRCPGPPFRG